MADGPVLPSPSSLAATTPDPLNMNTPDFSLTPSTATTTTIATPNALHLPQSSAAKPAKKRKSWGQALPEPKTNLPPRKRAKTADEKEQRRIERIKRNRAAAHNSRERKRQEAERLEVENHALKQQITALQQQLAQRDVTLDKCRDMIPGGLPQLTKEELANIKIPEESLVDTPASFDTIDPRASLAPSSNGDFTMTPCVKMEPMSPPTQMHATPSAAHKTSISLDQTQHSAAMLCDLQCRSSENNSPSRWSQIILYLMHLNLMTFYKSLMVTLWTLWPTRMAKMVGQVSTTLATSSTTTTATMSRRTRRRLAAKTSTSASLRLTSTTLFSLLNSLSLQLPALATPAQSFLATGPRRQELSALQALPFEESEGLEARIEFDRTGDEALDQVAANGHQGRFRRSGGTLGKSSSEERKDEGGIG